MESSYLSKPVEMQPITSSPCSPNAHPDDCLEATTTIPKISPQGSQEGIANESSVLRPPRWKRHLTGMIVMVLTLVCCLALTTLSHGGASIATTDNTQRRQQQEYQDSNFLRLTPSIESEATIRNLSKRKNHSDSKDYSAYSCDHLYIYAQDHANNRKKQCAFATTCNDGEGIFAPSIYCSTTFSTLTLKWILTPVFSIVLVVLFRMVASTAEDFFCPALEMLSIQMGLPSRFAGVTLLALGNGAPDIAAIVNAIRDDPKIGYLLGLGELTGAALFISTVVAGSVIYLNGGVSCPPALLRDVVMLAVVSGLIYYQFAVVQEITSQQIEFYFWIYFGYVVIVLVSDLYRKRIAIPRRNHQRMSSSLSPSSTDDEDEDDAEIAKTESIEDDETTPLTNKKQRHHSGHREQRSSSLTSGCTRAGSSTTRVVDQVMGLVSNYEDDGDNHEEAANHQGNTGLTNASDHHPNTGWSLEAEEQLPVVHMQHGGVKYIPYQREDSGQRHTHDSSHVQREASSSSSTAAAVATAGTLLPTSSSVSDGSEKEIASTDQGGVQYSTSWFDAVVLEGREELFQFIINEWNEIYYDQQKSWIIKILLTLELPFTIARQLTIPIPCDGYYCRPIVGISTMLSPFWFRIYFSVENDIDILYHWGIGTGVLFFGTALLVGLLILRFGPKGKGPMMYSVISVPLAIYGFIVAATWIDLVADKLVDILSFLGIVFHIPGSIMGLTVLAVGNSIGDLAANAAVARKGLANMAITACFAGPVFNYLIGLGLGFSALEGITKTHEIPVDIPFALRAGLVFTILNGILMVLYGALWKRGLLPKEYGYAATGIYVLYAVVLLFF